MTSSEKREGSWKKLSEKSLGRRPWLWLWLWLWLEGRAGPRSRWGEGAGVEVREEERLEGRLVGLRREELDIFQLRGR